MSNVDIYGIGQCSLDFLSSIPKYPPVDAKCEMFDLVTFGGGPVATALVALARWGLACRFCGIVGSDDYGRKIIDSLTCEGIDINPLIVRPDTRSQVAFIVAESASGNRNIFFQKPSGKPPDPNIGDIAPNSILQSKIVHTDGIFKKATLFACRIAEKAGIPVVVDAGSMRDGMIELAQISQYFIASQDFALAFLNHHDPEKACIELSKLGPSLTCVTLGASGYVAFFDGKLIKKKAYQVAAVDTTGCGDLFHAGFIYGLYHHWPMEKCLDFGAWAAAKVSLELGGRAGIPSLADVRQYCPRK